MESLDERFSMILQGEDVQSLLIKKMIEGVRYDTASWQGVVALTRKSPVGSSHADGLALLCDCARGRWSTMWLGSPFLQTENEDSASKAEAQQEYNSKRLIGMQGSIW